MGLSLRLDDPGLSTHLNRVPGATEGGSVAEIEVIQLINFHPMKQCSGKDVNSLSNFRTVMAYYLSPYSDPK